MPRVPWLVGVVLTSCLTQQIFAGPLTSAEVTKIINRVSIVDPQRGERTAILRDVIKDDLGIETGKRSRSELLFQDDTLTRLGAETFFSFKTGTRDLTLEKGSMLLQVPKGLGGAKIHTAAVTAAITGTTIMIEYIPEKYIKILVLEGSLRVTRNGRFGDALMLKPGKMVIMRPDAKKIPDPVDVDLAHIVQTSTLVNFPGSASLPSMPLIEAAIEQQQNQLAKNNLVPTNLVLRQGTNVAVAPTNLNVASSATTTIGAKIGTSTSSVVGAVASTAGNVVSTTTGTVNTLLSSTPGTVGTVANNLLGAASTVTSLPVTSTVDNVLNTTTSAVNSVSTNLLDNATATIASVPVASSSQLLSIVNNAPPTTSAIATVIPTVTPTLTGMTNSAPASTTTLVSTANNPVTSTTTSLGTAALVPSVTSTVPLGFGH